MNLKLHRLVMIGACAGGLVSISADLQAAPFAYTGATDVMLCFRKTQRNGGTAGPDVYEVNIGHASVYYGATPGGTVNVTQFTANQLNSIFDDLNNVSWSVCGVTPDGDGTAPGDTLWVTRKRININVQSTPPIRKGFGNHDTARTQISSVGDNAVLYSIFQPPDGTNNTVNTIRIPAGNGYDYSTFVGSVGNYNGGFWNDVEDSTASDFTSTGGPSRVDFYEVRVGSGPSTFLGYFDFVPAGTVTFHAAGGAALARPTITSIKRLSTTNILSFTTTSGALYNLRYTNSAGLTTPISSWPVLSNLVTGSGSVMSVTNVSSGNERFYSIQGHN